MASEHVPQAPLSRLMLVSDKPSERLVAQSYPLPFFRAGFLCF